MNKIEKMIKEMCPNGVERKKIKDVYKRLRGTPITASKMNEIADEDGDIRVFAGGKTVINAFEKDIPKANITKVPALLIQSRGVIDCIYYDKPFTFKNEMWAYTADNIEEIKFLYYIIKNDINYFREAASGMGSLPQISLGVTEDYLIPVPPIEVQREIVRILDNFTSLTAELTAELTARNKQYEYYRNKLLDFGNGGHELTIIKISELGKVLRGKRLTRNELSDNEKYPVYHGGLEPLGYYREYNRDEDTVMIINVGASAGTVGYCSDKFWSSDGCFCISKSDKVLSKYLYHYLKNKENHFQSKVRKAGIPTLDNFIVEDFVVALPNLTIQSKIVNVLDNFESICKDLNIGLPAEIEARKKQYEYYRDSLLKFVETGNVEFVERERERERERGSSL